MNKSHIDNSVQGSLISFFMKFCFIGLMLITSAYAGQPQEKSEDQKTNNEFSDSVAIDHKGEKLELGLTGLTIRKKFFLKIYSMAHYIEHTDNSFSENSDKDIYSTLLQHNGAKQISMVFKRTLTAKQIKESLTDGMKKNSAEGEFEQILPSVETFNRAITADVKENDEFTLRWFADGTLVSLFQGQEISAIKDKQFAKILWSIWFSDKSVVKRERLIEKLLTSS